MLEAVNCCHDHSIVHRDLKLENFFLSFSETDGRIMIKLGDFGIAYEGCKGDQIEGAAGTVAFMAPEVLLQQKYGSKSDSWSLGVILFEMLMSHHPYLKSNKDKINMSLLNNLHNVSQIYNMSGLSPEVQDLLSRLMTSNPDDRIGTANALSHPWF